MRLVIVLLLVVALFAAGPCLSSSSPAEKTKYDGVGFSGSGFFLVYQLGVLKALKDANVVASNKINKLGGLSGGAIAAVAQCSQVNFGQFKRQTFALVDHCANDGPLYCYGTLDSVVQSFLNSVLPANTHSKCSGKLFVDVSRVLNYTGACEDCVPSNLKPKIVNRYRTRSELIDVLRATAFLVDGVSSPSSCTLKFRDNHMCDGGYANRQIPCPTGSANCIKVSAYVGPEKYTGTDIYPGIRGESSLPLPAAQWNDLSMDAVTISANKQAIFRLGREDAKYWLAARQ